MGTEGVIVPLEQQQAAAAKEETKAAGAAMSAEDAAALKAQVSALEAKAGQYEGMLLDPAYVEYVAARSAGQVQAAQTRQTPRSAAKSMEEMTQEELAKFILTQTNSAVRSAVAPLEQSVIQDRAVGQIKEASLKFKDFWDYKHDMLVLAQQHPTLTAESAYLLAKANRGGGEHKAETTEKRPVPRTELPSSGGVRAIKEIGKGFKPKYDEAWKSVFGGDKIAE